MSASNRNFRGKGSTYLERPTQELPENVGNRRTFEELKIPPDNVGNHEAREAIAAFVHDGLGNSLDEEPSHARSGILSQFVGTGNKSNNKRVNRDTRPMRQIPRQRVVHEPVKPKVAADGLDKVPSVLEPRSLNNLSAEAYMATLSNEFTRLLRLRQGVPFSFSMKPVTDRVVDEPRIRHALLAIEKLICDILQAAAIKASVVYSEYHTAQHRFAVFFVSPKEKDPVKNKDLISALRQIVKLHAGANPPGQINVLLVLSNAQRVIEEHLAKLGAKKVETAS